MAWAQSSAWVDCLGLRSLVWTSLQSSWAWWELSGRRCWFCGLSTDPTAHHALWECTRSYADPMRSHAFNQSIAELWRDQPPSCWTAPTGNVDSPLLPAESLSTTYQPTMSFWNIFDTTWEGLRNLFKQKRFLRTLRSSCFLKNQMEVWWNLLEQILEGLHGGGSLGTPPFGDKSKPFRIMERHFQDVSKQQQISKSYWHHIRYPLVP